MKDEIRLIGEIQSGAPKSIVIDFGKQSRKNIKRVRKGSVSKLIGKIEGAVAQLRAVGTMEQKAQPSIAILRDLGRTRLGLPA
jgi:hypothetical protein